MEGGETLQRERVKSFFAAVTIMIVLVLTKCACARMASILFCVDLSGNASWVVRFCLRVNVEKLNGSQRSEVFTVFLLLTADNLKHFCVPVMGVNTVL